MAHDQYENPLISRYSSREMSRLWSAQKKFSTWRKLWVALAEAQQELGLAITDEQIAELKQHTGDIDFDAAAKYERDLRHDVMAHIHAYKDVCPTAGPVIHLGATSCYVTDNTDLLVLRDALDMVCQRLAAVIDSLGNFAAVLSTDELNDDIRAALAETIKTDTGVDEEGFLGLMGRIYEMKAEVENFMAQFNLGRG